MKKLLISTAALALIAGTALAAPGDNDNDKHHKHPTAQGGMARSDNNGPNGASNAMQSPSNNAMRSIVTADNDNDNDRKRSYSKNHKENVRTNELKDTYQGNYNDRPKESYSRNHKIDVRNNDIKDRIGVAQFRRNVTASRRFHAAAYVAPRGYHYQRWSYGQRLPSIYFARNYWLTDYVTFGLFGPPDGYVWVRFGPDALLIDEYSGDIVQVQYGVFY